MDETGAFDSMDPLLESDFGLSPSQKLNLKFNFNKNNKPKKSPSKAGVSLATLASSQKAGYMCKYCNQVFSTRWIMNRHMLTHTGRKVQCPVCKKMFTRKDNLNHHINKYHANAGIDLSTGSPNKDRPNAGIDYSAGSPSKDEFCLNSDQEHNGKAKINTT